MIWLAQEAINQKSTNIETCRKEPKPEYFEPWFERYNRYWLIYLRHNYIDTKGQEQQLFELQKYKNLCIDQLVRISYMLGSPNSCPICIKALSMSDAIFPTPHFLFRCETTEQDFNQDYLKKEGNT